MNLNQLAKEIKACQRCALRAEATQPVPGNGELGAKYFIIGEAPGRNEDSVGLPFVGMSGKRLNKLLGLADIDINDCFLSNVCRCRPPSNRTPKKSERLSCYPWLRMELDLIKPQTIITLGASPLSLFTDQGVSQLHGTSFKYDLDGREITIISHFHPAAALHAPRLYAVMLNDWTTMPDQVDASYTLSAAPKFPKFTGTYSLDTEQDEKGGLGEWSIAQRDAKGQMQVTPFYGAQNVTLDGTCVMHFAKYDLRVLDAFGMKRPKNVVDTHIAAYALGLGRQDTKDTGKSGSAMVGGLGLKYLARRHLGLEMKTWQQVKDQPEIKPEYNATDSVATLLLWEKWAPILPDHFWKIDMPLLDVLMAMEDRGIMVDPDFLRKYSEHLDTELAKIELPLNPFSYKEKAEYVYKTLGLPVTKFTKNKQPSVDKEVLETIDDPIIRRIIQYMELYKERGTYVQNYSKGLDENNRLHCEFKQTSTATSRLSSARPNLQNVTTSNKSELRKLFVAPEGKLLVVLDYKKLEFGVQAAITKDPTMIEAFLADKIHQETADALGVSYDDGKRVNFLIQNGGDAWKICLDFHIPLDVARKHVANYYKRFPAIARYHAQQKAIAKEKREVVNFFGRKRRLDAMFSEHWKTLREGEKEAMATPIQGSAAEVVKLAMIDLHYKHHAPMVSQVHDEILFEVPEKEAKEYAKWLEEYVPKLTEINGIYFPVSVGVGKNWAEAKH